MHILWQFLSWVLIHKIKKVSPFSYQYILYNIRVSLSYVKLTYLTDMPMPTVIKKITDVDGTDIEFRQIKIYLFFFIHLILNLYIHSIICKHAICLFDLNRKLNITHTEFCTTYLRLISYINLWHHGKQPSIHRKLGVPLMRDLSSGGKSLAK